MRDNALSAVALMRRWRTPVERQLDLRFGTVVAS